MRQMLLIFFVVTLLTACKSKKEPSEEKPTALTAFTNAYPEKTLPFSIVDTSISLPAKSDTISSALFRSFISDTIFRQPFSTTKNLQIYPLGRYRQKGEEIYFVTQVANKNLSAIYLSVFEKDRFKASMLMADNVADDTVTTASIDKKRSIVINKEWLVKNDLNYKRTILTYNNVGIFSVVLTETNQERKIEPLVSNPLDTFPKKYRYSGDYVKGKTGFLSIRDGRAPDEYLFFVHFTNDNEDDPCGGDLRAGFKMTGENSAVYNGNGDPCAVTFTFSDNQVRVQENGSCGNFRGIKCFFNDTYSRKKEAKPATKKKAT